MDKKTIVDSEGKEKVILAVRRPSKTKTNPDGTTEEVLGFIAHYQDEEGKIFFPVGPTTVSDGEETFEVKQD